MYKESNRLSDGLANYAFLLPLSCHRLISVLLEVDLIVRKDAVGWNTHGGYECN